MNCFAKSVFSTLFLFLTLVTLVNAQQQSEEKIKFTVDEKGNLFWNKNLPVYIKISSDPNDTGLVMKSQVSKAYTNPYYFDTEGINRIRTRWATDQQSHKAIVPQTEVIWEVYVDGIAPVTSISMKNTQSAVYDTIMTYGKNLMVELNPTDENSGIEKVYYSLNGENYKIYQGPFNIDKQGFQSIKYYSVDKVGNVEKPHEKKFMIDIEPPKSYYNITGISEGNIIAISTKIYLSTDDSLKPGSIKTFYKLDDEAEKQYSPGTYIPINHLKDGDHKLYFYSVDKVGNKENVNEIPFYLDLTAPIVASDVLGDRYVLGDKVFFSGRTKMKLTAVDNKSGVQDIFYSVDQGEFQKYDQPFYLPNIPGIHIVKYYATDRMQNNSEAGKSKFEQYKHVVNRIYVDLTGPILSHLITGPSFKARDTLFVSDKTNIKFSATDQESGVQFITFCLNDEAEERAYSEPIQIKDEGFQHVVYYGYDNVKNRNRAELFVYVDAKGPDIKYNFSIVPQGIKDDLPIYPYHVTLYLGATDQIIGAKEIYYSVNGGPEKKYALMITGFTKNEVNTVTIRALDLLGNETKLEIKFFVE